MGRVAVDLTGRTFGKLTVIRCADRPRYWVCMCTCRPGAHTETVVRANHLTTGATKSCGCTRRRTRSEERTPTSQIWAAMIKRCADPGDPYFATGVSIPEHWHDFGNFLEEMGVRPAHSILERKDVRRGYSRDNCIWVDTRGRANDRCVSARYTYANSVGTLSEWARVIGVHMNSTTQAGRSWTARDLRNLLKLMTLEQIMSALHPKRLTPEELWEGKEVLLQRTQA